MQWVLLVKGEGDVSQSGKERKGTSLAVGWDVSPAPSLHHVKLREDMIGSRVVRMRKETETYCIPPSTGSCG